jgi:hypothetical protein
MDWEVALIAGAAGATLTAVGLSIRRIRRHFQPVSVFPTGLDEETQAIRDRMFPPSLQHYWVPNGERPGPDGRWWVFLGATKTIFGFSDREAAVYQADQLNRREARGKYHPGHRMGVMVSTPMGYDDHFARRFFRAEAPTPTIEEVGQQLRLGLNGDAGPLFREREWVECYCGGFGISSSDMAHREGCPELDDDRRRAAMDDPPRQWVGPGQYRRAIGMKGGEIQWERKVLTAGDDILAHVLDGWSLDADFDPDRYRKD